MTKFEQRIYNSLKRKGLSPQFEHAGVYAILLDGRIVYIGKSFNMLARMAQHYAGIQMQAEHKYRVLAEATRHGHKMCFTVLYTAKASSHAAIEEEIGQKEGELIRQHLPPLNTQIPKAEDWHKWDVNSNTKSITLSQLLENGSSK